MGAPANYQLKKNKLCQNKYLHELANHSPFGLNFTAETALV